MNNQIKYMVERFLAWKLPDDFNPDGGISFKKTFNEQTSHPMKNEPVGTNLLDATQAEAMVRYMLEGLPATITLEALWHLLFPEGSRDVDYESGDVATWIEHYTTECEHFALAVNQALRTNDTERAVAVAARIDEYRFIVQMVSGIQNAGWYLRRLEYLTNCLITPEERVIKAAKLLADAAGSGATSLEQVPSAIIHEFYNAVRALPQKP